MKISKVNHTRTGIGLKDSRSEGIIYATPKQPDAKVNIEKHIRGLNETAKKLYSPFNSGSIDCGQYISVSRKDKDEYKKALSQVRDVEKQIKNNCKYFIKELAKEETYSLDKFEQSLKKQVIKEKYIFINKRFCRAIANECLRNSLKKMVKVGEEKYSIKAIMLAVIETIAGISLEREITEGEQRILHSVVREDYHKENQIKKMVKSFENKDTKVQVVDIDGEARLELSSFTNAKKKYISDFIHDYAMCDEDGKRILLSRQRSLLLLYVCGPDKHNFTANDDLMTESWGGYLPEDNEEFVDMIRDSMKDEDRYDSKKYRYYYDEMRMEHYGKAIRVEGLSDNDKKWIGYFNDEVGKLFKKRNENNENIIVGSKYIIKLLWKNWISYISMKYIDIGKAVYHFAMPETYSEGEEIKCGAIKDQYLKGISSFDYERIKAKENISRDLAVYTTFATNVFGRATVEAGYLEIDNKEDVLSITEKEYVKAVKPNVKRNILQYFGGKSRWENTAINTVDDNHLFMCVLKALKDTRNTNYHYSSSRTNEESIDEVVKSLFDVEKNSVATFLRKKYYSNNTLMFYSKNNIDAFMTTLYDKKPKREAQVPAFGNICKKADCKAFIRKFVAGKNMSDLSAGVEQFYASFYFMLKEIYYYDFLQRSDLKERFLDALKTVNEQEEIKKKSKEKTNAKEQKSPQEKAKENFSKYLDEYCKDKTFGELCQAVMTEYNQQNQNIKEVRTRENNDEEIYKHFRMLLYATLREAFEKYIMNMAKKDERYEFMKTPSYKPNFCERISEAEFCNGYIVKMYDEETLANADVASLYIMSHFITSKQLNQLQGSIKDYLQFIDNIEDRAISTCNNSFVDNKAEHEFYESVLGVLSIVMFQSGQISHCFEDYFDSEDDYAEFLLKYVEYADEKQVKEGDYTIALKAFCDDKIFAEENVSKNNNVRGKKTTGFGDLKAMLSAAQNDGLGDGRKNQKIGIYYDELNPIVNKNVINAKLFGAESKISKLEPVRRKDIKRYYELKYELASVFKQEKCSTAEEQIKLREYQDIKNMVELYDVTTYTEIMIDCVAQLVSYAYLRERDNMYFQLGYHYMHLFYGKDSLIEGEEQLLNISKGAILHQIKAIYDFNTPIVKKSGDNYEWAGTGQIGAKIGMFLKCYSNAKYLEGMYLFENINMHDVLSDRRKYIAHMKYMSKSDESILNMYTWMYNGFFDYDTKLKKSMSFVLKNILMKYFVKLELKAEKVECVYEVAKSQYINTKEKKQINTTETRYRVKAVSAEMFLYKDFKVTVKVNGKDKDKPLEIEARSKRFNENIKTLLEM